MPKSRQHQNSHGIGQIEEQLADQANAAVSLKGKNEVDQEVIAAANRDDTELDDIIEY